jgi:tetratricopeptide (TPR) repeat protein
MTLSSQRFYLAILAVVVLGAALYLPTLHYPLVWDDSDIITNNSLIRTSSPLRYFGSSFWAGSPALSLGQDPYYRPLTNVTFWVDYHLGGGKPLLFHLHNILIFSILTALLILLLAQLLRSRGVALAGGLLFAVHPLHSEVTSYVSGRTDLLMAFWLLASTYALARVLADAPRSPQSADRIGEWSWPALSIVSLLLACFAKETALAFPFVALVWFLLQRNRTRRATITVLGLFLAAVIYLYARLSVLQALAVFKAPASVSRLLLVSLNSFGLNAGLILVPFFPRLFYDSGPLNWFSLLTFLGLLALLLPLLFWRRQSSVARLGFAWLVLLLFPFASLVSLGPVGRLSFLPGIGILLLALPLASRVKRHQSRRWLVAGALVYCVALGTTLVKRNRNWQNEATLFSKMSVESPSSVAGRFNLAAVYDRAGNRELAASEYRAALRIQPDLAAAHNNLGAIMQATNQPDSALSHFREATRLQPSYPQAHNNLAILLRAGGDTRGAIAEFKRAIELRPDDASALYNLARIYFAEHEFELASPLLERAARLRADDPRIRALQTQVRDSLAH